MLRGLGVPHAAAVLLVVAALPAAAHVVADPNQGAAGTYFRTALRISHGCEGKPTVAVRVTMPAGVFSVKPQAKPGWTVSVTMRTLPAPVDAGHGRKVTEVVDEIVWRGGPLADSAFDEFGLVMKLPAKPGGTLWLRTVQECEGGEHPWTEIPTGKQRWSDLRSPAPFITLNPGR